MGRRDLLRVDAKVEVEYKSFDQFYKEYTKNISKGGIFIKTENILRPQDVLEISLIVPNREQPLKVVGEIVHVITAAEAEQHSWDPGMGVQFVDFEEGAHQALKDYVASVYKDQPRARTPDRRKHERIPLRLRVKFPNIEVLQQDYSEDISHGGIFIQTEKPRNPGDRFVITLVHPETNSELELEGEVVRVSQRNLARPGSISGMGIKFIGIDENKQQAIADFLGGNLPRLK